MARPLQPIDEIPTYATRFTGPTLIDALHNAADSLGIGGIDEVRFGYDPNYYSLGADDVEIYAWTLPLPQNVEAARSYLGGMLKHLNSPGSINLRQWFNDNGEERYTLYVELEDADSVLAGRREQGSLKRVINEAFGWDLDLRMRAPRIDRDEEIKQQVKAAAKRVLESGQSERLPPMNSYARRLAHQAAGRFQGIATRSVGDDRDRSVELYLDEE